ncbi:hypothetical protein V6N13_034305 [Hibiscus sabdariffa]
MRSQRGVESAWFSSTTFTLLDTVEACTSNNSDVPTNPKDTTQSTPILEADSTNAHLSQQPVEVVDASPLQQCIDDVGAGESYLPH